LSRRDFFGTTLAGGVLLSLPAITYRGAFAAAAPPSEQIRLGFVGVGREKSQGTGNLNSFLKQKSVRVTAVCDLDKPHLQNARGIAEKSGAQLAVVDADFRRLLDSKEVDAIVLTTPDHWHAIPTVWACRAGKDVYCEKPLSLTVREGEAMVAAAREQKRIVQTGSQQRSAREFRVACELVRNGAIGKLQEVKVGLPGPNFSGPPVADSTPPDTLDYDFWLGPTPERPFNAKRCHYLFRFFWAYSGGQQTNFGAHHLDIAQWALGMDDSGPVAIENVKATFHKDNWFETPEKATLTYRYANGVPVHCTLGKGGHPEGCTFIGEKGTIYVNRGKLTATPEEVLQFSGGSVKLDVSNNHHSNWLDCIKTRQTPIADVAIGHRSATVCHIGNIALRLGRSLTWDPVAQTFPTDKEAASMLQREYRKPWVL
jgi:predicted dehydrogenase